MSYQTDYATSKNWLSESIIFCYSSIVEPAVSTLDIMNFPFIHKAIGKESELPQKELAMTSLPGLEFELDAWDRLSDEAFVIIEKPI